jgi:Ni/Fe-hydrogenase subunit HybB-like protein
MDLQFFYVFCSLDVVSLRTTVVLLIRTQQLGQKLEMLLIPTLTAMLGRTIQTFCASIANLARLVYCKPSRMFGRRCLMLTL